MQREVATCSTEMDAKADCSIVSQQGGDRDLKYEPAATRRRECFTRRGC